MICSAAPAVAVAHAGLAAVVHVAAPSAAASDGLQERSCEYLADLLAAVLFWSCSAVAVLLPAFAAALLAVVGMATTCYPHALAV